MNTFFVAENNSSPMTPRDDPAANTNRKDAVMEILFSVRANNSRNIPSRGMMMSSWVILCLLLLFVLVQGVQTNSP